ncbi:MAG: HEAT repeat domain-containing protein [Nitrospirae bacterium]|nr:HEAT repeat domain-containing protein [Nitrospirota bacterium]
MSSKKIYLAAAAAIVVGLAVLVWVRGGPGKLFKRQDPSKDVNNGIKASEWKPEALKPMIQRVAAEHEALKPPEGEAPPTPPGEPPLEEILEVTMNGWREAILSRDPTTLAAVDAEIESKPETYKPLLMELAKNEPDPRVRAFSVRLLGRYRFPECFDLLVALLGGDPSRYVRENAAWALGELGDSRAADVLDRAADDDEVEKVREEARGALAKLGVK